MFPPTTKSSTGPETEPSRNLRYTVSSAVRGKGVGSRMMAYMTAWCWTIYPHVQFFRVRAPQSRGFYRALGFTHNGQDLVLKAERAVDHTALPKRALQPSPYPRQNRS